VPISTDQSDYITATPDNSPTSTVVAHSREWLSVTIKPTPISADHLAYNVPRYDHRALDRMASDYIKLSPNQKDPLILDLTPVTYMEHECLVHLGAMFADAERVKRPMRLRLPVINGDDPTEFVDFLRAWQFPEFIQAITRRPFHDTLTPDCALVWDQLPPVSALSPVIIDPTGTAVTLLPRDQLPLMAIEHLEQPSMAAMEAQLRFLAPNFKAVLRRLLGDAPGEDVRARQIATQIIQEAVRNAAMHPHAQLAYTTTQIRCPRVEDGPERAEGSLEISVWDNGRSFSDTLKDALESKIPIEAPAFYEIKDELFRVFINPVFGKPRKELRIDHSRPASDHKANHMALTVCAFLAGVTSVPGGRNRPYHFIERFPDDPAITLEISEGGGIGLRSLRRAAINLLKGQVNYSSAYDRVYITGPKHTQADLNITDGRACDEYDVIINRRTDQSWNIMGNHLQVSIPFVASRTGR